jgi:hypothetical protein
MLDESLVFHKTVLGQQEIAQATRTLAAKMRRALILVDGEKTVADLAPMFRPGEVDSILEELQASGHVTLDARKAAPPPAGGSGNPPG